MVAIAGPHAPARDGRPAPRRLPRGLTLVELLVVTAIIAVLAAMVLPAVQSARESARRVTCATNAKQLGLALQHYHEMNGRLPFAYNEIVAANAPTAPGSVNGSTLRTWMIELLPYLDMKDVSGKYDATRNSYDGTTSSLTGTNNAGLLATMFVPQQACPSNPHAATMRLFDGQATRLNGPGTQQSLCYGACSGFAQLAFGSPDCVGKTGCQSGNNDVWTWGKTFTYGMFSQNSSTQISAADVRDGLSNTIMLCETRGELLNQRGLFSQLQGTTTSIRINTPYIDTRSNALVHTGGNANLPTPAPSPGTSVGTSPGGPWTLDPRTINSGAASYHSGGATFCMGDASVVFITDSIDFPTTYRLLGNRNDGTAVLP